MKLTILGCYSATPRALNNPTSQILEMKNNMFLIDCGEGTQVQLRKHKIKFNRIKHIFISHLHGDHFFGLVGLISTFRLLTRETDLHIYGPKGIKEIITLQMKFADSWTNYKLIFHELSSDESELIYENKNVQVFTIPLKHRVYTNGFLFKEKKGDRKLDIKAVEDNNINVAYYRKLQQGFDVQNETGEIIKNSLVTKPGLAPKSYAFCSDTVYNESMVPLIKDVSVLYHESTFLDQHKKLADPTKHSTAKQAASIAKQANAGTLILGHFSTRYGNINVFKEEALSVFENVELAEDGKVFEFN